jgi:hypothetical protein
MFPFWRILFPSITRSRAWPWFLGPSCAMNRERHSRPGATPIHGPGHAAHPRPRTHPPLPARLGLTAKVLHDVSAAVWTGTGAALAGPLPKLPCRTILCDARRNSRSRVRGSRRAHVRRHVRRFLVPAERAGARVPAEFDMTPYQRDRMEAARFHLRELAGTVGVDAPHQVIEAPIARWSPPGSLAAEGRSGHHRPRAFARRPCARICISSSASCPARS